MTTPTTPAADAVSLDSEAPTMRDWIVTLEHAHDESLDELHASARSILRGVISEMKKHETTATARESALVAERDALRADLQRLMDKHNVLHVNAHAARVERDALRAALPQWLPLSGGIPPDGEVVLISYFEFDDPSNARVVCAAFLFESQWFFSQDTEMDGASHPYGPTHYMPLPAPPTLAAPAVEG